MKKTWHSLKNRVTAMLLALICVLGLLPSTALAAGADTIKLERFGMSGVSYQSASLGRCTMHQLFVQESLTVPPIHFPEPIP